MDYQHILLTFNLPQGFAKNMNEYTICFFRILIYVARFRLANAALLWMETMELEK